MNNFYKLYSSLNKKEEKQFNKFIRLEFKPDSIPLQIFTYYAPFKQKNKIPPNLDIAFENIFGHEANNKKGLSKLSNGLSDLFLQLKEFLTIQKFKEKDIEKDLLWLEVLEGKKLSKLRDSSEKKLAKKFTELKIKNIWHPFYELKFNHFLFFRNSFQKSNPDILNLQIGLKSLEEFYTSMKMKFSAEIINRKKLLPRQDYNLQLDSFLPRFRKINLDSLSKNSELYFTLYQFLKSRTSDDYHLLKNFIEKNEMLLHPDEKLTTIIYMLNFLAEEIKKGNSLQMKEAFKIYKFGLEKKILIHKEKLDELPFNNIVNTACYLKKYDWAKQFINDNKNYLEENIRKEASTVSLLIILFKEKKFDEVVQLSLRTKFTNVLFKISGQIHFLASLYELERLDELFTPLDSFIRFLNINKLVGKNNKEAAINFAKILKSLMHRRLSKQKLEEDIEKKELLFFRTWLKEKISSYTPI